MMKPRKSLILKRSRTLTTHDDPHNGSSRKPSDSLHSDNDDDDDDDDKSGQGDDKISESDGYASTELGLRDGSKTTDEEDHGDDDDKTHQQLGRGETRAIQRLRLLFALVLLACTVVVAVCVYMYVSGTEQAAFEEAYNTDANKVLEAIGKSLDKTKGAIDAYAVSLMSYTRATNQTWPWVYFPDFPVRTSKVLGLSDSIYIGVFPIVTQETRPEWEAYSMELGADWVTQSMQYQEDDPNYHGPVFYNFTAKGQVHHDFFDIPQNVTRPMLPTWQAYPVIPRWPPFNWDLMSAHYNDCMYKAIDNKQAVMSYAFNVLSGDLTDFQVEEIEAWTDYYSDYVALDVDPSEPISDLIYPLINDMSAIELDPSDVTESAVVGVLEICIYWRDLMKDTLKEGSDGIVVVFENSCSTSFTYEVNGPTVLYLGINDLHDSKYDNMRVTGMLSNLGEFSIRDSTYTGLKLNDDFCQTVVHVYPSATMEADYKSANPILFTCVAVMIFLVTTAAFLLYDWMVERRQKVVMRTAIRSTAIVSSLFPSNVRDQLEFDHTDSEAQPLKRASTNKKRLQTFLTEGGGVVEEKPAVRSAPIAELFPETTVLFADIAGFTAWASQRDPIQVFTLLETLYGSFDEIAEKRGVFKVETIGDCYVAVVGLPKPKRHHALVMARFADDCLQEMAIQTRELAEKLGPDTYELQLRVGINSGPTTAGVLRGQKARFQLFGDTVNTAARMESTGERGRIHCSQKTADLIIAAGKVHWLTQRAEQVEAKGKGRMQTFWVQPSHRGTGNSFSGDESGYSESAADDNDDDSDVGVGFTTELSEKLNRYVAFNVDIFENLMRIVISNRSRSLKKSAKSLDVSEIHFADTPLQEVTEMIELPQFDAGKVLTGPAPELDPKVLSQLRDYISVIARTYRPNPFHNFEHASHVLMATKKLLSRVVNPEGKSASQAHSSTYGITSDPIIQLAVLFAALVHDCDHSGVPNNQLINENPALSARYAGKSVAEQNSVDIAWDLLMMDSFADLQHALFVTEYELRRFRQLVVNAVMATDIFDKDIKALRESRWEKAFSGKSASIDDTLELSNRKATIVLEYIIQAADVSHCMQHWKIYQKWNRCLFEEMYTAYQDGRSDKNPAIGWDKGELWFFDFYIIPLAKKLKECGVFGVACDEFLDYAKDNRDEVANKGSSIVEGWLNDIQARSKPAHQTQRITL